MRTSDRAAGAIWLAVVWLVGMEVIPAVHLATHHRIGAHSHGGVVHVDAVSATDAVDVTPEGSGDHGEGSLEHRGVCALAPVTVVAPTIATPIAELVLIDAAHGQPSVARPSLPPARGPPRV